VEEKKMSNVWKPIVGYEGLYEVAPCGAIRNARTLRWLSPQEKDDGYMSVKLFRDGVGRNKTVHRIVAEAFLPNPESKPQVNHKDLNKKNNDVSNLEWVTQAENQSHAIRNGTNKTRISKLKMSEKYHEKFYQMTCLFPPQLFVKLDALAIKTGVSKSEMIREATTEYVKRHTAEEGES
jgi:hypothetical protein